MRVTKIFPSYPTEGRGGRDKFFISDRREEKVKGGVRVAYGPGGLPSASIHEARAWPRLEKVERKGGRTSRDVDRPACP